MRQSAVNVVNRGWAQREGGPIEEIRPGDVVWFLPARNTGMGCADHGDDAYRHSGKERWQGRGLDGARHR